MFNHECSQRGGEVVGACMDGFLFGACCQLKSDSQSHIPKGPGVVMTSYLDYPEAETETDDYDSDQLNAWHNSFKPVVTPGYRPGDKNQISSTVKYLEQEINTEGVHAVIISEGVNHITNALLNTPDKEDKYVYIKPVKNEESYTHNSNNHGSAETILLHKNGSIVDNVARPSDFNVHISSMQTKPTTTSAFSTTTSQPKTVSTHWPVVFTKPSFFKLKPTTKTTTLKPSTENYIKLSTISNINQQASDFSSINSIISMLNETNPLLKDVVTVSYATEKLETKSSPAPGSYIASTYSSYPSFDLSTGHYVTLRPSSIKNDHRVSSTTGRYSTKKPFNTKPINKYTSPNSIPPYNKFTTKRPIYSSSSLTPSTSQAIEVFNRYPTDPSNFGDALTTFSIVSPSTPSNKVTSTSKKPPSTSYVSGSKPLRRPGISPSSGIITNYDGSDTFSSVTPTVIVLSGFQTTKTETVNSNKETQYIEISQEPFKKPISQITVNNHIESTNNIYMAKPPSTFLRPSSPAILITPKPSPSTTLYPSKATSKPYATSASSNIDSFTEFVTTLRPELQTSPDDLINFPPVRNPMLNATGSNLSIFNTSVASDNELEVIHDVEFTTPTWQEDEKLKDKMNLFVNKIVGSLQGTFQELHDIVILDKKPNATILKGTTVPTTYKPPKKTLPTRKPQTTKKPSRLTTTKKPAKTTKRPTKLTTAARKPTTTSTPSVTTKRAVTTTQRSKPTKKVTTTTPTTTTEPEEEAETEEAYADDSIDYSDRNLCGVRPMVKSGRIVGGKNAKFGEWPWQVLVRESTWLGLFTKNKCGGVLITSRFVTTAAHCQPGFLASLVAVFGENDISGDLEPRKPTSKNVRRVIVHRQYDAATFENDLALLELESPIKFDAHIVPICMPPDSADFTGRMATVTGWGRLKYGGGVPAVLQEVQVPVIENAVCQEMFQTAGHSKRILSSFLCAGYANGQKDSCEGDSGGPLVLQREDGKWQLVGTVSHGIKCASPYLPGVYMRTTYYKPWLKSITGVH